MATTKQEALAKVSAADLAAMAALREKIEAALLRYDGTYQVTVTPSGSRKAQNAVADEYRAAGWTVDFGDDQRDGAWMTFK